MLALPASASAGSPSRRDDSAAASDDSRDDAANSSTWRDDAANASTGHDDAANSSTWRDDAANSSVWRDDATSDNSPASRDDSAMSDDPPPRHDDSARPANSSRWRDDGLLGELRTAHVVAVLETMPLSDLAALLVDQRVPALVVVDELRLLRGLVTRTDVIVALSRDDDRPTRAADVMSTLVFALPANATIESAAALMAYERVGQVVVVGRAGELVTIVSSLDIAGHVARRAGYSHA